MFLESIDNGALSGLSPIQIGFILSIRNIDPALSTEQLCNRIAEMFPPVRHVSQEILALPSRHLPLRKVLDSRGAIVQQHSSKRIMQTIAHDLYSNAEDRKSTIQSASLIISHDRKVSNELSTYAQEKAIVSGRYIGRRNPILTDVKHKNASVYKKSSFSLMFCLLYRRSVRWIAKLAAPCYMSPFEKVPYFWRREDDTSRNNLQRYFSTFPIVLFPGINELFSVFSDAYRLLVGASPKKKKIIAILNPVRYACCAFFKEKMLPHA